MPKAIMKQTGLAVDYTAGADVAAGDVVVSNKLIGIAKRDIPDGATDAIHVSGIFDVEAENDAAWALGEIVYWHPGDGEFTKTASGATLAGRAAAAKGETDTRGLLLLNPFVP
jgi:predicted RecA/RadA family phage recombinase